MYGRFSPPTARASPPPPSHPEPAATFRSGSLAGWADGDRRSHRTQRLGEEVVALVIDNDEGGELLHLDPPDGLHSQLGVLQDVDLADALLRQARRRAADPAEALAAG